MVDRDRKHNWTKADALAWLHNEKSTAGREDARRLCRQLGATEAEMRAARRKDWSRQVTTILDGSR